MPRPTRDENDAIICDQLNCSDGVETLLMYLSDEKVAEIAKSLQETGEE